MHFDAQLFTQYVIIGVADGALIALIALGYTLVYGIVELINFAHGEVFMMGAFAGLSIVAWSGVTGKSPVEEIVLVALLAFFGAMLLSGTVNWGIDRIAYRRLRNAPRLAPLICAIGFSFILQNIGIYWKGSNPISPPQLIPTKYRTYNILTEWFGLHTKIRFKPLDLVVIGLTIPLLFALSWFIHKTRTGKAMRATAQDRAAAELMGVDVNRTISVAFILGGLLAGAAGMLALYYNNNASFQMGFRYGLFAFTAAVLGGIGNLNGFIKGYFSGWGAEWTPTLIFGVLVVTMVFRPGGLFGDQTTEKV
jgi:branched-chain amino acid transport system permease protein